MPSAEHLQNIDEQSLLRLSVSRGMCGKNATRRVALHFWPGAEGTAQIHQLAQMVGVVIRKDQRFAQYRLALAMRDFCEEIGARVLHQADHVRQIFLESGHTIVPGLIIGRHGSFWPVAAGTCLGFLLNSRMSRWAMRECSSNCQPVSGRAFANVPYLPAGKSSSAS